MTVGDVAADFLVRFEGYRGPSDLLAVLVREGDLAAARVPVSELATRAAAVGRDGAGVTAGQVGALRALTDVWRVRLVGAAELARLDEEGPDETGAALGVDPALSAAVDRLRELEGEALGRMARRPTPPASARLGGAADLAAAYGAAEERVARRGRIERLWPLPVRIPIFHHMRRVLTGLRTASRMPLFPTGASRGETVAATLAALELVRRGRARLRQRQPYARVDVLRPRRPGEERGA